MDDAFGVQWAAGGAAPAWHLRLRPQRWAGGCGAGSTPRLPAAPQRQLSSRLLAEALRSWLLASSCMGGAGRRPDPSWPACRALLVAGTLTLQAVVGCPAGCGAHGRCTQANDTGALGCLCECGWAGAQLLRSLGFGLGLAGQVRCCSGRGGAAPACEGWRDASTRHRHRRGPGAPPKFPACPQAPTAPCPAASALAFRPTAWRPPAPSAPPRRLQQPPCRQPHASQQVGERMTLCPYPPAAAHLLRLAARPADSRARGAATSASACPAAHPPLARRVLLASGAAQLRHGALRVPARLGRPRMHGVRVGLCVLLFLPGRCAVPGVGHLRKQHGTDDIHLRPQGAPPPLSQPVTVTLHSPVRRRPQPWEPWPLEVALNSPPA